jgi:hypothetical protein
VMEDNPVALRLKELETLEKSPRRSPARRGAQGSDQDPSVTGAIDASSRPSVSWPAFSCSAKAD